MAEVSHAAARNKPPNAVSKDRLRLWLRLLKAHHSIEQILRQKLRDDFGSTLPRFDVMSALARHPDGLKMSDISKLLKVSNGNITGIVDRLSEDGLAVRAALPGDRRAQLVRLTNKGHDTFQTHATAHEGWINDLLAGQSPDDMAALSKLLDGVCDQLQETGEIEHA